MTRRRYTKAEKIASVMAAEMTSPTAAAQASGVPETNIRRWRDDPELAEYGAKTREELADGTRMLVGLLVDTIAAAIRAGKFEPRDLAVLLGITVEKSQLLGGGPTSRTETRTLSDDFDDDEKQRLRDWIDALPTTADVPEGDPA